jgi:hypothetical protein
VQRLGERAGEKRARERETMGAATMERGARVAATGSARERPGGGGGLEEEGRGRGRLMGPGGPKGG